MTTSGHVCDIPTLLSFFFKLHHDQSSTLHRISFIIKMCFLLLNLTINHNFNNYLKTDVYKY